MIPEKQVKRKEMKSNILVVDDEVKITRILKINFQDKYNIYVANNGEEALSILQHETIHLVLTDLKMPEMTGTELLKNMEKLNFHIPVIIMTAFGSIRNAVESLKQGAYDYIVKPLKIDELEALIAKALNYGNLLNENYYLKEKVRQYEGFRKIITIDPVMLRLMELVKHVASAQVPVLIEGESGTGKELFARAIHYQSQRSNNPFVEINCGAIPGELIESELFGHEKGSFTGATSTKKGKFEVADKGTLFLDEIGELPKGLQVKLLKALEEQQFTRVGGVQTIRTDVRIIAATNRNLQKEIENENFREDLYYRLKVVLIQIPPLREHKDDIPLLANHFLEKHKADTGKSVDHIDDEVLKLFEKYEWPGNVRELENLMIHAMLFTNDDVLTIKALPPEFLEHVNIESIENRSLVSKEELQKAKKIKYREIDDQLEYDFLKNVLTQSQGNISQAAIQSGYDRRQLQNLIKKHRLNTNNFKQ